MTDMEFSGSSKEIHERYSHPMTDRDLSRSPSVLPVNHLAGPGYDRRGRSGSGILRIRPSVLRVAHVCVVIAACSSAAVSVPGDAFAQSSCARAPLALQVLGSGGPIAGGTRASTSYLVWKGGRAIVMVDVGGGAFLRFGEAGAQLADLSLLAISHLHPDHVADLPALLWLSEAARQKPLKIAGPSGAGVFPGVDTFVARLFNNPGGAFPIMAGTLGQNGRGVRLEIIPVDASPGTSSTVFSDSIVRVSALAVPHADVPSIAYRVEIDQHAIVFGSDQNGSDARFSEFASGADLLVMHFGISEMAPAEMARLHARPSTVGRIAQAAKPKRLVLSHFMQPPPTVQTPDWFSLFDLSQAIAQVRTHFSGPIETAVDLQCIPVR